MKTSKVVGIDLGTTNSVIAMVGHDGEEIICRTDRSGRTTFPSVVVHDVRSDSLKAGQVAANRRGTTPEPITSIKSHMGDAEFRAVTGSRSLSPIEVSAEILSEMKRQMQDYLSGRPGYEDYVVERAVITIPAHFPSNAREATTMAGEAAGLTVEFTLQEPTAAVLYYCQHNDIDDGAYLVYDLGGGTFDVSVVKVEGGDAIVVGIAGNNYLGGDNFDDALANMLLKELREDPDGSYALDGFDPIHDEDDKRRFTKLRLVAEAIKKSLSREEEHYEEFSNIFVDKDGAQVNLAVTVTREQFYELIQPLLEETLVECRKALAKAAEGFNITLDGIDAVLLVGGSTHVPLVGQMIAEAFTDPTLAHHTKQPTPLRDEPDMAVGYGAAIAAAGAGTSTLDDLALAVLQGDDGAIESLDAEQLVLAPEFQPGNGFSGTSIVEGRLGTLHGTLPALVFVRVNRAGGGFTAEFPVATDGTFALTGLLAPEDNEPYSCEFVSGDTVLGSARFDAAIRNIRRASIALSRDYFIETMDADGTIEMVQLMKQGQELPVSQDFEFSTNPNNQHFAQLRFFEQREFLKQITIAFDSAIPPGTKVKLSLACNVQSKFSARAEVAGIVVDTQFEPSPPGPGPRGTDLTKAVREGRTRVEAIQEPGRRIVEGKRLDKLAADIDTAIEEGDGGKARDKLNEMQDIAALSETTLKPTREEFEQQVEECEQANVSRDDGVPDASPDIAAVARDGRRAFQNEDQGLLTGSINELKMIGDSLKPDTSGGGGDERPPLWMLCQHFGSETRDLMAKAEERTDLPEAFRAQLLDDLATDRSLVRQVINDTRLPMPDEEAANMWDTIRRLYQKWERSATISGTIHK